LLDLYREHIWTNHLEVGVGTEVVARKYAARRRPAFGPA
jgi:hypothetical protein